MDINKVSVKSSLDLKSRKTKLLLLWWHSPLIKKTQGSLQPRTHNPACFICVNLDLIKLPSVLSQSIDSNNIHKNTWLFRVSISSFQYIYFICFKTISSHLVKIRHLHHLQYRWKNVSVKEQFNAEALWKIILCHSF